MARTAFPPSQWSHIAWSYPSLRPIFAQKLPTSRRVFAGQDVWNSSSDQVVHLQAPGPTLHHRCEVGSVLGAVSLTSSAQSSRCPEEGREAIYLSDCHQV